MPEPRDPPPPSTDTANAADAAAPTGPSAARAESAAPPPRPPSVLGQAVLLGTSWTWVIGMFLPVLLMRDFGLVGMIVFVVPNVVGAAAMGWVLRDGSSERLTREHAAAMALFSLVTMVLHGYFIGWALSWMLPVTAVVAAVPIALRLVELFTAPPKSRPAEAAVTFAISLVLLAAFTVAAFFPQGLFNVGAGARLPSFSGFDGAWLLGVTVFGFVLCPYLDLTFHRARRELPSAQSRGAFTLGFGVVFAAMTLATLTYAVWMTEVPLAGQAVLFQAVLLFLHLFTQAGQTTSLHRRELAGIDPKRGPALAKTALFATAVAGFIGFLADRLVNPALPADFDITAGEVGYRLIMGLYGLVFPAYVWLAMIPTRDGHSGFRGSAGRYKRLIWSAAVGLALPMFFVGGVWRGAYTPWLVAAVLVPLVARVLLPGGMSIGRPAGWGSAGPRPPTP